MRTTCMHEETAVLMKTQSFYAVVLILCVCVCVRAQSFTMAHVYIYAYICLHLLRKRCLIENCLDELV